MGPMIPEAVTIIPERPDTADAEQLISELEAVLAPRYLPESRHGLSGARHDQAPSACGA